MTTSDLIAIGDLAKATGVSVSALRYYDERGVITSEVRAGGRRWFRLSAVGRVNLVRRAQRFGFSLSATLGSDPNVAGWLDFFGDAGGQDFDQ